MFFSWSEKEESARKVLMSWNQIGLINHFVFPQAQGRHLAWKLNPKSPPLGNLDPLLPLDWDIDL